MEELWLIVILEKLIFSMVKSDKGTVPLNKLWEFNSQLRRDTSLMKNGP